MSMADGVEAGLRVTAALDFLRSGTDEDMRAHCIWCLDKVMADLRPEDLSTPTLVSLLAILIPDHSRILTGRPPAREAPILRLVKHDTPPSS